MNIIKFQENGEFQGLVSKIVGFYNLYEKTGKEMRIQFRYALARAIINNPLYQKAAHGTKKALVSALADDVAKQIGGKTLGYTAISESLQLLRAQPDEKKVIALGSIERGMQVFLGRSKKRTMVTDPNAVCNHLCNRHCLK